MEDTTHTMTSGIDWGLITMSSSEARNRDRAQPRSRESRLTSQTPRRPRWWRWRPPSSTRRPWWTSPPRGPLPCPVTPRRSSRRWLTILRGTTGSQAPDPVAPIFDHLSSIWTERLGSTPSLPPHPRSNSSPRIWPITITRPQMWPITSLVCLCQETTAEPRLVWTVPKTPCNSPTIRIWTTITDYKSPERTQCRGTLLPARQVTWPIQMETSKEIGLHL